MELTLLARKRLSSMALAAFQGKPQHCNQAKVIVYVDSKEVIMSTPAKLKDIIDALGFQMDEILQYLNRETGKIEMITREELALAEAEEIDADLEWEDDTIELTKQIVSDREGKFVELPSKFEINDYEIMESFCYSVTDQRISNELAYVIKGSGAFRRFKDRIYEYGMEKQWYQYRDEALEEIAKDWCKRHQIVYE
jgi:hypothetical protein